MRDDNVSHVETESTEREQPIRGRRSKRSGDAARTETTGQPASDVQTPLSALATPVDVDEASLSDDEIALYRRRVAEGLYNTREVADEVARRMMRRGDI